MATPDEGGVPDSRRVRLSQADVPALELDRALKIARILWDEFAGKGARPLQIAEALEIKPSSGGWRELTGASIAYGLTEGGYNAQDIKLTELGRRIVAPTEEGMELVATAEAALTPRVCREFFDRYKGAKFPQERIATSVLFDMGVPKERTEKVVAILKLNGEFCGLLRAIKGEIYVSDAPSPKAQGLAAPQVEIEDVAEIETSTPKVGSQHPKEQERDDPKGPRQLFIAHGKNQKPLEDLKKVLDQFKISYRVAVDEPHSGRPISAKVADMMRGCSAGIFIFTKDEKFTDSSGREIWRPSENAVYELGAGSILWDSKIIVLKEEGVNFASDYQDIGYITFSEAGLAAKALDILKELVGLGLVQVQAV